MERRNDIIGKRFGRLMPVEAISEKRGKRYRVYYLCKCDCGNIKKVETSPLLRGETKSCGCLRVEMTRERRLKNGFFVNKIRSAEYNAWAKAKSRCYDEDDSRSKSYRDRGIVMCSGWRYSFENFMNDMGVKPTKKHSLDRIDNDLNYSCGHCDECIRNGWKMNCRWGTIHQQANNKTTNHILNYFGISKNATQWAIILGSKVPTLRVRARRYKDDFELVVKKYYQKNMDLWQTN